nr:cytidine deaminase [Corynebacterium lactis]
MSQISDEQLLAMAYHITENSYVPYSGFPVGAALLLDDGTVVTGCNVENASYGLTMCAERNAVFRMVAEYGPNHKIEACAIVGRKAAPCHPCGACRQVLHEFGCKRVIVESERPEVVGGSAVAENGGTVTLGAPTSIDFDKILPYAFGPEDL